MVFKARCHAVGLLDIEVRALCDERINTTSKLAFVRRVQPGSSDDKEFVERVKIVLKLDPIPFGTLSALRRLWFEANAMAISEVKSRYEKTEDSLPKKLPLPEREHRRLTQQTTLAGIKIQGNLEPAHMLVDMAMTMKEEDVVRYIDPSVCVSREMEVKGIRKESMVKADASGALRTVSKDIAPAADLSTEYRLRLALQRRSLALDQMGLMTYQKSEDYHTYLFDLLMRSISGAFRQISVSQIMEADKHIWARISEYCRTGLAVDLAGSYPMETALDKALLDPITVSILQPMPSSDSYRPFKHEHQREDRAPWKDNPSKGKKGGKGGKGKGKKGGKGANNERPSWLPPGLQGSSTNKAGKRICFNFNLGTCQDKNCNKGVHTCCKCFGDHSFQDCPRKG